MSTLVTVDWKNKIIFVPKAEMILIQAVPTEIRQLDLDIFRKNLKDLEDDAEGMTFLDTHRHNTTVTVGGAVLARVVEIINGYTVTFEDGQYAVNLVGANSNVGDVVNVNQVSVRSSNSAGLQDLNSLQAASYADGVTVDIASSYTGTVFPVGTRQFPSNNLSDAVSILQARGLKKLFVARDMLIDTEDLSNGYNIIGENINISILIADGANTTNCEFNKLRVSGILDNSNLLRDCVIGNLVHVNGIIFNCGLAGTVSISGDSTSVILESYSVIKDGYIGAAPMIDMTDATGDVIIRAFNGDLHLNSCTNPDITISVDIDAGTIHLDSNNTAGTFIIKGSCELINDTTGSTIIIDKTIQKQIPELTWGSSSSSIIAPGSIGEKIRKNMPR